MCDICSHKIQTMKRIFLVLIVLLVFSCEKEESNLIVTGQVRGLKKGTLYLERLKDTTLVVIDSMIINGEPEFVLHAKIDEPEVLHLSLNSNTDETPRVTFFADKGTININTSLKRFFHDAKIEGSEQQKLLNAFNINMRKFSDKNLELLKEEFDFREDSIKVDSIRRVSDNLLKRKYLYVINYALNNKESEIAPYLALSEVYDANIKYLDTLYNSFPENIAKSKYGIQLADFIKERKQESTEQ